MKNINIVCKIRKNAGSDLKFNLITEPVSQRKTIKGYFSTLKISLTQYVFMLLP